LDVLERYEKQIGSLKGEFLPFLVKLQLTKKLKKGGLPESVLNQETLESEMSSSSRRNNDGLGCFACVLEEGFCMRVNTIQTYLDANREITRVGITSYSPWEAVGKNNWVAESSEVDPKTQIGPECIVGDRTKIGERSSVKKSNIGKQCKIGNNVKIINSVIMDNVTILDKCTIQNCIVCDNATMADSCSIKDCQVGSSFKLEAKSDFKNENLVAMDE